jgi:5-deoxy-D-glucuronate isomerase
MAQALAELETSGDGATLTNADSLGLLIDREVTIAATTRRAARLCYAPPKPTRQQDAAQASDIMSEHRAT